MKLKALFTPLLLSLSILAHAPAMASDNKLDISFVKAPFNLQVIVMKELGLLEKELKPLGVEVVWHEITSGAKQARAMAAGSLDVSSVMNTTSIQMAAAEGNPIKVVAGVSRPLDVFAVVAAKGGVTDIKSLKGKTVAGPKGTVLHQILVAALAKNGMSIRDVNFIQMDLGKAFAALQTGQVDAALLSAAGLIKAEQAGCTVLTTAKGLVTPKLGVAASDSFIKNHPDQLAAVIKAHNDAWAWIEANHDKAIELGAKEQKISLDDARKMFEWSYFTQTFDQSDLTSMNEDLEFMLANNMMRNRVDSKDIVLPQALR
ncbi:MAG: NrtA/SsuA/CpmA family ABC transporter substrate-binding protein [Mailhella sp.]|nr:NrtA/SsuA/CpmA family ABC transporter substrate-binding protein [Mailhella sp.]